MHETSSGSMGDAIIIDPLNSILCLKGSKKVSAFHTCSIMTYEHFNLLVIGRWTLTKQGLAASSQLSRSAMAGNWAHGSHTSTLLSNKKWPRHFKASFRSPHYIGPGLLWKEAWVQSDSRYFFHRPVWAFGKCPCSTSIQYVRLTVVLGVHVRLSSPHSGMS